MAKFNIKDLLEKHTKDGEVDYAKINEELEVQNRNIVAKEASKEVDKIKEETLTGLIKDLGIDGNSIDDVKLYIKQVSGSTDEAKEEVIKLTTQINKLKKEYDAEVENRTKLETDIRDKSQTELLKTKLGIDDEKQIEFFKWDFNRKVNEETPFEAVLESYIKENDIKPGVKIIKDDFGARGSSDLDIGAAWKAKREFTRK